MAFMRKPRTETGKANPAIRKAPRRRGGGESVLTAHPVAVSLICGAVAVAFVCAYAAQVNTRAEQARSDMLARYGGEQVEVCVASRDVAAGEVVDASAVSVRLWVSDLLPSGALRLTTEVIGRKATSPVVAGEVFCEARFAEVPAVFEVPAGMVAVSVPAKEVQAVGGAIEPGMKIDIYATGSFATQLIGSDVLVLATSRQPGGTPGAAGMAAGNQTIQWITLALEPESVEETVAAAQNLTLYFTLPGEGAAPRAGFAVDDADAAQPEEGSEAAPAEDEDVRFQDGGEEGSND